MLFVGSTHDNKGKGMYGKRFGPIEDEGQNATLHEVYIPVNKNGYGQSPAESKNGDGQSTAGSKNGDGQSLAESKSRDGQSLAESKSRDGQSPAESKSGDGRNIYYLHTCHQRNHESVDQFFIRCKVRTASLS